MRQPINGVFFTVCLYNYYNYYSAKMEGHHKKLTNITLANALIARLGDDGNQFNYCFKIYHCFIVYLAALLIPNHFGIDKTSKLTYYILYSLYSKKQQLNNPTKMLQS